MWYKRNKPLCIRIFINFRGDCISQHDPIFSHESYTKYWEVLTFPNKDLAVGSVVQDEAVVTNQQVFGKWTLLRDFGQLHRPCRIRNLQEKNNKLTTLYFLISKRWCFNKDVIWYLVERGRVRHVCLAVILWTALFNRRHRTENLRKCNMSSWVYVLEKIKRASPRNNITSLKKKKEKWTTNIQPIRRRRQKKKKKKQKEDLLSCQSSSWSN